MNISFKNKYINHAICSTYSSISISLIELSKKTSSILYITETEHEAIQIVEDIRFLSRNVNVVHFPDRGVLAYDMLSVREEHSRSRIETLIVVYEKKQVIIVSSISTLLQLLPPVEFMLSRSFSINIGDIIDTVDFTDKLSSVGYRSVKNIQEVGEFALRGSIFDFFPLDEKLPIRLDLIGDKVDRIFNFSIESGKHVNSLESFKVIPSREFPFDSDHRDVFLKNYTDIFSGSSVGVEEHIVYQEVKKGSMPPGLESFIPLFFDRMDSFFDYIPKGSLLVSKGNETLGTQVQKYLQNIQKRYISRGQYHWQPMLKPYKLLLSEPKFFENIKKFPRVAIYTREDFDKYSLGDNKSCKNIELSDVYPSKDTFQSKDKSLLNGLKLWLKENENHKVVIVAKSLGREQILSEMLGKIEFERIVSDNWIDYIISLNKNRKDKNIHRVFLTNGIIKEGFYWKNQKVLFLLEEELFARAREYEHHSRLYLNHHGIGSIAELGEGDLIVHDDFGIGRYNGIFSHQDDDFIQEFIEIEFAHSSKLFISVSDLYLIQHYQSIDGVEPNLSSLSSNNWKKTKDKAKKKIEDTAAQILSIYAKRSSSKGIQYELDKELYSKFVNDFPYKETSDQQDAIDAVISDMCLPSPMDRLICGDVGLGKTEIAMRAAFIAVSCGKQVVVLAPTTLLVEQHYERFQERFYNFDYNIQMLSRFQTPKKSKEILDDLEIGKVNILIATHRILQDKVSLMDLGLLVIDEEHRFGVKQKELLKKKYSNIDILMMTATPIPRTLQMALSDLQDLSIMISPPSQRLPIKTFIVPDEGHVIVEAIERELSRGGQIFYVYNDVKHIQEAYERISKLVPGVSIAIAHGQLKEKDLERVMLDFYHRRYMILICSTIIETGIDVSNVNTIFIHRSDKFGLAQLHQLRGRVGRSYHQAYCYLIIPDEEVMTDDATKRLEAIIDNQHLGGGFNLAIHDLEIRGAGEVLGKEQSGHVKSIGYGLYIKLLEKAIKQQRNKKNIGIEKSVVAHTKINFGFSAILPPKYVDDVGERLFYYQQIADISEYDELTSLQTSLINFYGDMPEETINLFFLHKLRIKLQKISVESFDLSSIGGKIVFNKENKIKSDKLVSILMKYPDIFKFKDTNTLAFSKELHSGTDALVWVNSWISELTDLA